VIAPFCHVTCKSSAILQQFQKSTALLQTFDAKQCGTINQQRQIWALLVWYEIHSNRKKDKPQKM
jgi:hypothetical protein